MEKENSITYRVWGNYALFSDPINRMGGEKFTYQIPTYQALVGITESIYWKPTFRWVIDELRVMKPIRSESKGIRPLGYTGGNTLSVYTYLSDVEYQVKAHFEWNENRPELAGDRNEHKHHNIAKRMIERGGRRDVFLGARECQGYVTPCVFGEGAGCYDQTPELAFGLMYHGITYADEAYSDDTRGRMSVRFWYPVMRQGVIAFDRPEQCPITRPVREMECKPFGAALENFIGAEEFGKEVE